MSRSSAQPPFPQHSPKQKPYVPVCESCGEKMRPTKIEPHGRIRNILVRMLACDCGNTTRDLVASISAA